jgi:hypothetical protein
MCLFLEVFKLKLLFLGVSYAFNDISITSKKEKRTIISQCFEGSTYTCLFSCDFFAVLVMIFSFPFYDCCY